jgi:hypothetical protein
MDGPPFRDSGGNFEGTDTGERGFTASDLVGDLKGDLGVSWEGDVVGDGKALSLTVLRAAGLILGAMTGANFIGAGATDSGRVCSINMAALKGPRVIEAEGDEVSG